VVQDPHIAASRDWTFAPDFFFQPPQNIATDISINGVSLWNRFLKQVSFSVKEINVDLNKKIY
jgi:hypothetical protein